MFVMNPNRQEQSVNIQDPKSIPALTSKELVIGGLALGAAAFFEWRRSRKIKKDNEFRIKQGPIPDVIPFPAVDESLADRWFTSTPINKIPEGFVLPPITQKMRDDIVRASNPPYSNLEKILTTTAVSFASSRSNDAVAFGVGNVMAAAYLAAYHLLPEMHPLLTPAAWGVAEVGWAKSNWNLMKENWQDLEEIGVGNSIWAKLAYDFAGKRGYSKRTQKFLTDLGFWGYEGFVNEGTWLVVALKALPTAVATLAPDVDSMAVWHASWILLLGANIGGIGENVLKVHLMRLRRKLASQRAVKKDNSKLQSQIPNEVLSIA